MQIQQVQCAEELASRKSAQRLIYPRERVSVLDDHAVQLAIIHAKLLVAVLFPYYYNWGAPGIMGRLNQVSIQKIFHLTAHFLFHLLTQGGEDHTAEDLGHAYVSIPTN